MSGIIHLVCKYQSRHKFLTFGKKQEKNVDSSSKNQKPSVVQGQNRKDRDGTAVDLRRFSCDMQRSPTLPADIRRSPQKFQPPPALVARLMGLEAMPESAEDQRRKLLGALEKCNEDLNALKKIIEAVQMSELQKSTAAGAAGVEGEITKAKRCWEINGEPSPVSVLDEFNGSPWSARYCQSTRYTNGRAQQQQRQLRKKPGEEEMMSKIYFHERMSGEAFQRRGEEGGSWPEWSSKAMIESLDEVCRDIAWGERREIGRIGLALQDHICSDLIEEITREMGYCGIDALPFEACKRRLCF